MWIPLLLIPLTAVTAAAEGTLALSLSGPDGSLAEAEVALPYAAEYPLTVGRHSYVLSVRADLDGESLDLTMALLKIRRSGAERWLKERSIALAEGQPGELTLSHRAGDWAASGAWVATRSPPPQRPPPDGAARYVLVWADAALSDDPRSGRYTPRGAAVDRDHPEGALTPFRVVKEFTGEILEAEALPEDGAAPRCYFRAIEGVNDWGRQFFLRREDLAAVTTRQVTLEGDDGTAITLAAGVALTPEAGGYRVELDGLRFVVPLPEDAVGWAYRPSGHFPSAADAPTLSPLDGALGQAAGIWVLDDGGARSADGRAGVRRPLVTTRAECLELTLEVDPQQLR